MNIIIKNEEQIKNIKEACKIAHDLLDYMEGVIKIGITTDEIDKLAGEFIISHNATPSFLGYEGYPKNICVSVNDEVVHGIGSNRKLKNGDVVTLDVGACVNGCHSDTARTYKVGHVSKDVDRLLKETKRALYEGIKTVKNGSRVSDISKSIESVARKNNFAVYRELTGHGVGVYVHEDPYIPNYYDPKEKDVILKTNMVIAIEPMFGLGKKDIVMLDDDWTIVTEDGSTSAHFEHTVLVTDTGYEILTGE